MAHPSTLYRFHINLSDVTRNVYEELELRVPMHPSESVPSLLTRVIAFALNVQEGLEFTQGISDPDLPALCVKDLTGAMQTWIDVGVPSARRLHKASKSAKEVRVYSYRDPENLLREVKSGEIFRLSEIRAFSLDPKLLSSLGATLERQNKWDLLHSDGEISIVVGENTLQGEIRPIPLKQGSD